MNKLKKEKGITLVALIITIVVLLILAIVAIGAVKDSKIIGHAQKAGSDYTIAQEKEQIGLAVSEYQIQKTITGDTDTLFYETVKAALNGTAKVEDNRDETLTVTFNKTDNAYIVDKNGNITAKTEDKNQNENEDENEEKVGSIDWIYAEMPISETEVALILACTGDAEQLIIEEDEVIATKAILDYETGNFTLTEETASKKISDAYMIRFDLCETIKKVDFGNKLSGDITNKIVWNSSIQEIKGLEGVTNVSCSSLSSLEYVELPSTLLEISDECFELCSNLKKINIPESVTSIGNGAFNDCRSLTLASKKIPKNINSIGHSAFANCRNITSIDLSECNLKSLGNRSFNDCYALTELILPSSLEDIGYQTFSACTGLKNITINKAKDSLDLTYSGFSTEQIANIKWVG